MFKNAVIAVLIACSLVLLFSGCGGSSSSESVTLDGTWSSESDNDSKMVAVITDDHIQITLDAEDVSSLYWKGTFPQSGETVTEGATVTSVADQKALASSMLGSGAKNKVFTYENGTLDFDFTIMGTTRTIHLKKE